MIGRPRPNDPRTPAQEESRAKFTRATRAWRSMSLDQSNAWRDYAWSLGLSGPTQGPPTINIFMSLAVRFAAVNPNAEIPLDPPTAPFGGDDVRVDLGAAAGKVVLDVRHGNSPGVVTEILFQPLASIHRATYAEKYRSQAFVAAVTGQAIELPARPGVVAVAIRMVESATGQAGALLELGRVVVA